MPDVNDMSLLQDYNRHNSEEAFAELVQRHVNLVYSAALRHTGIPAHAEELTQAVFVILARKAGALRPDTVLEAWLYETTRFTSLSFMRGERRRRFSEQEAYMQSTIQESNDASTWTQIGPLLDEAMARLGKKDREAVVLRFFKEMNLREVAVALNVTEAAAQSRVHRALEKLRRYFSKRGVASTTAIIAGEISAHSVHAAPAGLATTISAVAVAKGATASTSTLTLIKGALKIMAWTKAKTAIAAAVIALVAAGTTTVVVKRITDQNAERQNDVWRLGITGGNPKYLDLRPYRTLILPTEAVSRTRRLGGTPGVESADGRTYGLNRPLDYILGYAFCNPKAIGSWHFGPARTILNAELPTNRYDYFSNWPTGAREALQAEIKRQFGLTGEVETIETNTLVLEVKDSNMTGLQPQARYVVSEFGFRIKDGKLSAGYMTMDDLARKLETTMAIPVINETGLTTNRFDFTIPWNDADPSNLNSLNEALTDRLGLELVPTNMPVQMLVVNKSE